MKFSKLFTATVVALIAIQAPAQTGKPDTATAGASATMPLVKGEVRKLDFDKGLIVLRHGDIPSLAMPAMTMGFDISSKTMLDGLKAGDRVQFQAEMVNGKATVTELKRQ